MSKKTFLIGLIIGWFAIFFSMLIALLTSDAAILRPQGIIAQKQYDLLVFGTLLSLIVVIPVFSMLFFMILKYRDRSDSGAKQPAYEPENESNKIAETIWWGVPILIIIVLSVITWQSTHDLDPYKRISSPNDPVKVQVVALQWKWLFIYPEEGVASLNQLIIPEDRPIDFEITADAPMNSFWIPQLGGQIYAMAGMRTELHLMADNPGIYRGSSSNISGEDFAKMNFETSARTETDYQKWVQEAKQSSHILNWNEYEKISTPSTEPKPTSFVIKDNDIFDQIFHKYGVHYHPAESIYSKDKSKDSGHMEESQED